MAGGQLILLAGGKALLFILIALNLEGKHLKTGLGSGFLTSLFSIKINAMTFLEPKIEFNFSCQFGIPYVTWTRYICAYSPLSK